MTKTLILILTVMLLYSCSTSKEAGVICKDKKGRWVWGNAKPFQQRHDYKLKKNNELPSAK